jgi:hypothetical protein
MVDFDEMKKAMHNALHTEDYSDYRAIADIVFGLGAIPCEHYAESGLYKSNCSWCKAARMYEALTS